MKGKTWMSGVALLLSLVVATWVGAADTPGAAYTMTNAPDGNDILVFARDGHGMLTLVEAVPTGGDGSGAGTGVGPGGALDPLGSQGSLVLSPDGKWLLAVNAGSNEVSVFRVGPDGLIPTETASSGGEFPVSVTIFHDLVYVLNADLLNAATPNITGFELSHAGELEPLADSTRSMIGTFAQVGFSPQGRELVVTDKATDGILVFQVDRDGLPSPTPEVSMASGLVPFGFVFDPRAHLLVSEAGSGAVSSYDLLADQGLETISPSVANGQAATCWVATTGTQAFTANTGSSTLSAYAVHPGEGSLMLLEAVAGTGNLPIDMDVTTDGRFLYVLNAGDGTVGMFRITAKGTLIDLGSASSDGQLALFAHGMAAW